MSTCLRCNRTFYEVGELFDLKAGVVCDKCKANYKTKLPVKEFEGMKARYVYMYDDEKMSDLLSLKGMGIKEMSDALILPKTRRTLKRMYKDATFIYMPSNKEDDEERGFKHVEVLFHDISKEGIYPLEKAKKHKQALLKLQERRKIKEVLKVRDDFRIPTGKIVLVDDIISSGSTLRAAKELLGIRECEILVLLWNHKDALFESV